MVYENIGKETEQVEFKKSTGELREGVISIVSILNKHGQGELYFGVKNNGDVIGQEISDSTPRDISQAVGYHIKPPIYPEIVGQSETCIEYINNAMDWKADIIGTRRVETPEVPVEAVREAVINSFGHRMYNNGQNNEIDVFKDRIEIHTTGGFPEGHTPDEFFSGEQKPIRRNRLITRILYFSKDMETFATGLKRIKDLCDEAGCIVKFRMEKDDFVVAFYRNLRKTWQEEGISRENPLGSETTTKLPPNYPKTTPRLL